MADTKWSQFPSASDAYADDEVVGLKNGQNSRFSFAKILALIRQNLSGFFVPTSAKGAANGVASLDNTGKVPSSQLPPIASTAADVTYDNTGSGLTADDVQEAIDELAQGGGGGGGSAANVAYDPTTSGLTATNVQDAIDEVVTDLNGKQFTITANGILKGDGAGGVSAATAGTDYQAPLTAGTDYATPTQLADKANPGQIGYPESGTTASRNYSAGEYICWNGLTYTANQAISSGTTLNAGTGGNLTEVSGGGFNRLAGRFPTDVGTGASANNLQSDAFGIYAGYGWLDTPSSDRYKNGIVMVIPRLEGAVNCFQLYFSLDTSSAPLFIRMRTSSGTYTSWSAV